MFVRMKAGAYAGQVREIKFEAAREMIADGRAERVDRPDPAPAETSQPRAAAGIAREKPATENQRSKPAAADKKKKGGKP